MVFDYLDFILEEFIRLDAPLYMTKRCKDFFDILAKDGDPIATDIVSHINTPEKVSDVTWIDLTDKNDMVSFIQVNRILRYRDEELGDPQSKEQGTGKDQTSDKYLQYIRSWGISGMMQTTYSNLHPLYKDGTKRTELNVGRFATKILTKFKLNFTPVQINKFVDNFKAEFDFDEKIGDRIEMVEGDDIRMWYDEVNYYKPQYHLYNSCMKKKSCQRYFGIYTENPNKVKLCILKSPQDDTKIIARALLWELSDGRTYLDRPYANEDRVINAIKKWGLKKKWQVYGMNYSHLEVNLDRATFDEYPYMDTFKYLNRGDKLLSTDSNEFDDGNEDWIRLESTGGGYEEAHHGIYSEYYGEYIDEDSAVYAEDIQSYIHSDDSYWLEYRDIYVSNEADVVYSEYDDRYYLSDDAIDSKYLGTYIYAEDAIEVNYTPEDTTWVPDNFMVRGLADEYLINNSYITCLSTVVFKSPFAEEYFFRNENILVYKLEDGNMVTEVEAEEKDIDLGDIKSEYVSIQDYLNKVEKISKEEFFEKLQNTDFTQSQVNRFKELVKMRSGYRSDMRRFFNNYSDDVFKGLIKLSIYYSYNESEKNDFGKPRRNNKKEQMYNDTGIYQPWLPRWDKFIDKSIIDDITLSSFELLLELADAQLNNLVSDENFLAQIILLKKSL